MASNFSLPVGWRLGKTAYSSKSQSNVVSLFYKSVWADRFIVDKNLDRHIKQTIKNPPYRLYPALYKDGLLDLKENTNRKGIWKLIDEGCITPEEGYHILPDATFIRTAKRRGVWQEAWENKSNIVRFEGRVYKYKNRKWFDITEKHHFQLEKPCFKSIWDARVKYSRDFCTIQDVAEYSLSAVLECAGDQVSLYPENGDVLFKYIIDHITEAIEKPVLRGFSKIDNDWVPIYSKIANLDSPEWYNFCILLQDVCSLKRSGYEARLVYTNGYTYTIKLEHTRFIKAVKAMEKGGLSFKLIHIPFLRGLAARLEKLSLTACRDYLQTMYSQLFSIGAYTKKNRLVFFNHNGCNFGLWVDSGKIFKTYFNLPCYAIPYGYDKLSVETRKEMVGKAYEEVDEEWDRRCRKARRSFYYMVVCKRLSRAKALFILNHRHLRTDNPKVGYKEKLSRSVCASVNKTAKPISIRYGGLYKLKIA